MTKAMIEHEIKMLQNKLREVTRLDMWQKWSYEDEKRLEELLDLAKLRGFDIK